MKKVSNRSKILIYLTLFLIANLTTVRLLLALTSPLNLYPYQLDVHNSFLHGDLNEDVYMSIPKGINSSYPNQVCKLLKSIYGLKQSSRPWFDKLFKVLLTNDFNPCAADHSFFIHKSHENFTTLLIYVDDLIIIGNNLHLINKVKATLHHPFHIKDLGP